MKIYWYIIRLKRDQFAKMQLHGLPAENCDSKNIDQLFNDRVTEAAVVICMPNTVVYVHVGRK